MTNINAGLIPRRPVPAHRADDHRRPIRSPAGTEALWAYTHVPQHVRRDAGGQGITGRWDRDDAQRMADRMQQRIERAAPGFTDRILARRILAPPDLQIRDANLAARAALAHHRTHPTMARSSSAWSALNNREPQDITETDSTPRAAPDVRPA
jgi:phytoene dehydrogenase-like protein